MHVFYDTAKLREIHEQAGFLSEVSTYLVGFNLGVCNPGLQLKRSRLALYSSLALFKSLQAMTALWWVFERCGLRFRPNSFLLPYVIYVGRSP